MEYKKFMDEVFKKGYAEKVPSKQLDLKHGQVWYIPHHSVCHLRKCKLRVVFDCAASYKGTPVQLCTDQNITNHDKKNKGTCLWLFCCSDSCHFFTRW